MHISQRDKEKKKEKAKKKKTKNFFQKSIYRKGSI
jgi:hypothetical protein